MVTECIKNVLGSERRSVVVCCEEYVKGWGVHSSISVFVVFPSMIFANLLFGEGEGQMRVSSCRLPFIDISKFFDMFVL
jgi:hypothetical protein